MTTMTDVPRSAEAVVVGGGTVGAWTAWFLTRAGVGLRETWAATQPPRCL